MAPQDPEGGSTRSLSSLSGRGSRGSGLDWQHPRGNRPEQLRTVPACPSHYRGEPDRRYSRIAHRSGDHRRSVRCSNAVRQQHFWLPKVIRKRSLQGDRLKKALEYVKPVTRWTDKVVRTRFTWATREPSSISLPDCASCSRAWCRRPKPPLLPLARRKGRSACSVSGLSRGWPPRP